MELLSTTGTLCYAPVNTEFGNIWDVLSAPLLLQLAAHLEDKVQAGRAVPLS